MKPELQKIRDEMAENHASEKYDRYYHPGSKHELEAWTERKNSYSSGFDSCYRLSEEKEGKLVEAREILQDLVSQREGLKNSWAGMWFRCKCQDYFSAGGNWTVSYMPTSKDDALCVTCRAQKFLSEEAKP